jgi:hypothetical protein
MTYYLYKQLAQHCRYRNFSIKLYYTKTATYKLHTTHEQKKRLVRSSINSLSLVSDHLEDIAFHVVTPQVFQ